MPAPNKTMLTQLAKVHFLSKNIELPTDWEDRDEQYKDAFDVTELAVPPNAPTNLFLQATLNKYHVATAKKIGDGLEEYMEGICGAICDGIDKWMKLVTIAGVMINGPLGMLMPGGVVGPPLMPLILATAPKATAQEIKYSKAIATTFGVQWQPWHMGLMGQLMYPAFAAFPGPVAPPTPNIPIPLVALSSPGEAGLSPATLKSTMEGNLGDPEAQHSSDIFDAIAKAFGNVFPLFKISTLVKSVLGTGPVPTFAPPFVPVGPVLGGVGTGAPGCLS